MASRRSGQQDHPLRGSVRPDFEHGRATLNVVDLFSGCGGLSLGVAQAANAIGLATDLRLAIDIDEIAALVYGKNFPLADIQAGVVEAMFDGALGTPLSHMEADVAHSVGDAHVLVGGPPCQGHSNLNNHTRRNDPKNALYVHMARAAEVLDPDTVLIENVPAVVHDQFASRRAVDVVRDHLVNLGYQVHADVVALKDLGVAQNRRRHILLATKNGIVSPQDVFVAASCRPRHVDLRWAIGDLEDAASDPIDVAPKASQANLERMNYLLENDAYDLPNRLRPPCHQGNHSYKSMYGRLRWDKPAQTVTSGFGSIGQGRYMHPSKARALTPHEAARIQGFPDYFDLTSVARRSDLATMIGNAVPPQLASAFFDEILRYHPLTG